MTTNLERIKYELELAGYNLDVDMESSIESDRNYANRVAKSVYDLAEVFANQGHSGYSASMALSLFKRLVIEGGTISDLTDNADEWSDITAFCDNRTLYQSKRDFSCFSEDLKTYYDIDEDRDKDGNRIMHTLKPYEGK